MAANGMPRYNIAIINGNGTNIIKDVFNNISSWVNAHKEPNIITNGNKNDEIKIHLRFMFKLINLRMIAFIFLILLVR